MIEFWILGSIGVAFLGRNRKFGFWGYFFASLLFTPLVGILFVIASAPAANADQPQEPAQPEAPAPNASAATAKATAKAPAADAGGEA